MKKEEIRLGVIKYVVENLKSPGKMTIQKTLYFVQESLGVPLGYEYVMHYYGPYSFELDDNLTEMQAMGILAISSYLHSQGGIGYEISLGKNAHRVPEIPLDYKDKIDRVVRFIKSLDVEKMELCATIHFVQVILKEKKRVCDEEAVVKGTKQLKPKFSEVLIKECYQKLKSEGLLALAA